MRLFQREDVVSDAQYCCQEEGMVGLGPGARSYTKELHYSSEYAVGRAGVKSIIQNFIDKNDDQHGVADYGIWLNLDEQKRRYLIKSLLKVSGLDLLAYHNWFGSKALDDFPQIEQLFEMQFAISSQDSIRLTAEGISYSDSIGPWLYSEAVQKQMEAFELT